ncbi:hypothetical protein [Kitasatospora sp. NPDC001547]|uniref:hypothetical protein n=1 Tax=Kitasatospora sp. NPDC001547 TaxID=3364015 RepID=UPI003683DCE5
MGCACQKGCGQFEAVADEGAGRVLFASSPKPTAETVFRRYPGSIVREKGTAGAKTVQ